MTPSRAFPGPESIALPPEQILLFPWEQFLREIIGNMQGGRRQKFLNGAAISDDDVIISMTSLLM